MSEVVEIECDSCGAITTVEVSTPGDLGSQVKFCPVCGEELDDDEDDDDDDDDFWELDEDDDDE